MLHDASGITLLALAFGAGLLHALDADHIVAVTGLASTNNGRSGATRACFRWAAGHGLAITAVGSVFYVLGLAIPPQLSRAAEAAVGLMLVGIGVWIVASLLRRHAHLHFHTHASMVPHAHWHSHPGNPGTAAPSPHVHEHGPLLVGMVHGVAGSAPLLALIPLGEIGSRWLALGFLAIFSAGVLCAMLLLGGVLKAAHKAASRAGEGLVTAARLVVAAGSIGFGTYLVGTWV